MAEFAIESFEQKTKDLIVNRLLQGVSQRKIVDELNEQGISISDVSISRWWKENKNKYIVDITDEQSSEIDSMIEQRLKVLDKKPLKQKEVDKRLLAQQLLQELMLRYIVDINNKTKLKQQGTENHYPTELISSLKIISELYLKIKEDNRFLKDDKNNHIF